MDVEVGRLYPVFDVHRGAGRAGRFTFPDMTRKPYGNSPPRNEFRIDHPGTLLVTFAHIHPGGLYDELDLIRPGATARGGAIPGPVRHCVRLFRSQAHYFDKRGPVSWHMAMTETGPRWRPEVRAGDTLRTSATYETRRASWYESMGIMPIWEAFDDDSGIDPFSHRLDQAGHLTHGHLRENNHHGGARPLGVDPSRFRPCRTRKVVIGGFLFNPGDFTSSGSERCVPTISKGQTLTFVNADAAPRAAFNLVAPDPRYIGSIFHSVTACQEPCSLNTGISYPLADGAGNHDSGQLGARIPAIGTVSWSTPRSLVAGTYTYYCRIHPFMRGVFRIVR